MMQPAILDALHTQLFCRELVPVETPIIVACRPIPNQPENECFPIVEDYVAANGGKRVIGWSIWERPGVFIEAEFHAVWRSESGQHLDIAPRPIPFTSITFLPDPERNYDGFQVDNIRKPLVKDNDLVRYLFLFKRRFEIVNTGDLAGQYGEITLPKRLHIEYVKLMKEIGVLQNRINKRYPGNPPIFSSVQK